MSNLTQNREPQTRVEQAGYVIERIQSLGIRIHPASRLMLMLRTLKQGLVDHDDDRFSVALESIRDMYQQQLIVDQMEAHRENPRFRAGVERLLQDAALPQDAPLSSLGRDTQFELYLAAVCLRGGLHPVDYDEPDIVCQVDGRSFGIAAKRLKSMDQFKRRVREGADQMAHLATRRKSSVPFTGESGSRSG